MKRRLPITQLSLVVLFLIALGCGGSSGNFFSKTYQTFIVGIGKALVNAFDGAIRLDVEEGSFERNVTLALLKLLGVPDFPALIFVDGFELRISGATKPLKPFGGTLDYAGKVPQGVDEKTLRVFRVVEGQAVEVPDAVFDYENHQAHLPIEDAGEYFLAAPPKEDVEKPRGTLRYAPIAPPRI